MMTTWTDQNGAGVETSGRSEPRDAASRIAQSLCAAARWDDDRTRCNWLGHRDVEDPVTAPYSARCAALSPELYSGSAGVALFLGEAWRVTGDQVAAETARAALRRSVSYLRRYSSPAYPFSVYAGHLGLLLVAVRLEELGLELGMEQDMAWLLDHAGDHLHDPHPFDVIGGNAGAIPALHYIGRRFRGEACLDLAARLADELCRTATWSGPACSWTAAEGFARLPAMTGFSHGASGMAVALLRQHALTGEPRLLEVARGAFEFEDERYNPGERNWVDTRYPHEGRGAALTGRFRRSYCHGAPGIALARAMAAHLDPARSEQHRSLACAAIETTRAAIADGLCDTGRDATLCHGLAGLSEILFTAGGLLDDASCRRIAEDTAAALITRYPGDDYPSGLSSRGRTPCLMVGTAGIGLHFLRLTTGGIPSPLVPDLGWSQVWPAQR